jgi:purine-cytosine permease-like protein
VTRTEGRVTQTSESSALSTASTWLCRLSPIPWMVGVALFLRHAKHADSLDAAVCLVLCFISLGLAVVGLFGLLRHHSLSPVEGTRPPMSVLILGAIGILGGIVVAMSSVLISDLSESGS